MVEWETTDSGLRIAGSSGAELSVDAPGLEVEATDVAIPRPTDVGLGCRSTEIRIPGSTVTAAATGSDDRFEIGPGTEPLDLPPSEFIIGIQGVIEAYVVVQGPATIAVTDGNVVVTLPDRGFVRLGFRSRNDDPPGTITVPATPTALATAISHLPAAHDTTGPDRTFPRMRDHPPLIETGDELEVPPRIAAETPDTGIELSVPPSLEQLFVVTPLAYHLQAEVTVEERLGPVIRAPSAGVEYELEPVPELERDAARRLKQVFFLDCLVRNAGPYGTTLAESSLLDALNLSANRLYHADPADRLATYLDVPYAALERRIPDWHLSMYVSPEPQHLQTLPHLLDRMALIFRPRTSELEGSELVERSLDDFYRGTQGPGQVASVDIVKPELKEGRVHGWLADGIPIDVFKASPEAYRNRLATTADPDEEKTVTVVLNDDDMADEHADVADIYRNRAQQVPMDLRIERDLPSAELARTFEADTDFVHYIGHCEEHGLRCPDGYLSATSLDTVGAETFFLNACGSFHEGMELVARGSVAGAITFSQVLNEHAVKVGSAFARLLVNGFGFERAMRLARRRIMMGKDYAVVGDGTHTLTRSDHEYPTTATLELLEDGQYLLTYDQFSTARAGAHYRPDVDGNEYAYLCGNESEFALDRSELEAFLDRVAMPVIYDGDFYWSDELGDRLE